MERILSLEALPDDILHYLRSVHNVLNRGQNISGGFTLEVLVGGSDNLSSMSDMMKFLRNAILLCLTTFPRNYILEEAALIAEELFVTKMNSGGSSVTPCRSLAKNLLKSDRQVVYFLFTINIYALFVFECLSVHHVCFVVIKELYS